MILVTSSIIALNYKQTATRLLRLWNLTGKAFGR